MVREYGDPRKLPIDADVNTQVNFGHLVADDTGNTYFAFDYLPEPTVRKFDRAGYLLDGNFAQRPWNFSPRRRPRARQLPARRYRNSIPSLHRIITAIGVDPQTQELWLAIGTLLMHFDKDGQRMASFRTYLPDGGRLEASTIWSSRTAC